MEIYDPKEVLPQAVHILAHDFGGIKDMRENAQKY
jgi:hypothetical protein